MIQNILNWFKDTWHIKKANYHAISADIIFIDSCGFDEIAETNPAYKYHLKQRQYHISKVIDKKSYCEKH